MAMADTGQIMGEMPTDTPSSASDLCDVVRETGWERFVVKPTISAGSFMTKRFTSDQVREATEFAAEISIGREAMVQPYMASVETGGEVSLIHIDGELTHCIVKEPRFSDGFESVSAAFQPDASLAAAAATAMKAVPEPWLYARVDLMRAEDGQWLLSELELIEPSLFFLQHPPALERFIAALMRLVQSGQRSSA